MHYSFRLATGATLPFPGAGRAPTAEGRPCPIDFNYDFKTDLVLTGAGGGEALSAG